ncbi:MULTISPECIES: ABC transporter permease [Brevibacillus]|uniref:ABC transporter permease n=1 Tax=Brevibacillus TaxID=55080 RepID=UPI0003B18BC9|nr:MULTISPECIES: ABC transporter permease [Brevibacillus]ERM16115.1 sodium:proton antiporter [Brevibacillus laterosporus PE36]MBA4533869.1 ABC transporter permease [Brevibacillus halotolerans]MCR8962964.1 ABC transporter permease [Brevibacillus laterosporus]MCZ0835120.1 ABC transporter permease [Brevibacillus halotolerans]
MNKGFFFWKTLRLVVSLLLFSFLLYELLSFSTGDPALGVLRKLGVQHVSQEAIEEMRTRLGIDGNFLDQYFRWLLNSLKGDFGDSFMTNTPVLQIIAEKAAVTLKLIGISLVICIVFSLSLGGMIGNFPALKWLRQLLSVMLSFPIYWIAILAIFIFGVQLKWFPFVGSSSGRHLILPIFVICFSEGCYLSKMVSDLIVSSATSEQQIIAKFRGIKWYYRFYYQLKELFVPLISLYGNSLINLIGGTVIVEIIFSISGLGKLLMDAISTRDYPVIQGITLIIACVIFLLNYFVDLLIQKIDMRIQLDQGGE